MSETERRRFIFRLRAVGDELTAVREALAFVQSRWSSLSFPSESTLQDFKRAIGNLETTYLIRLFSEFEGILMEYVSTRHPLLPLPDKPTAETLINEVSKTLSPPPNAVLIRKVKRVRDYRNVIVHPRSTDLSLVPFPEALTILNTFVSKLQ